MTDALRFAIFDSTGQLNWEALSAIGTVGALWFAVIQSSRAQRLEHLRAVGTLTALIGLVEPITEAFPIFDATEDDLLGREDAKAVMGSRLLIHRAIEGLRSFPIGDLAAVEATEYAMALPLVLQDLEQAATPRNLNGKISVSRLNGECAYVREACDYFRIQRQYLKHGSLIRRLAALPIPAQISPEIFRAARRLYPKRW